MTICVHAETSSHHVLGFAVRHHMLAKREPPVIKPGGAENTRRKTPPLWLSFSTAHRRDMSQPL